MGKLLSLLLQAVTAGLAAAFVVVLLYPDILGRDRVVQVIRSAPPPARTSGPADDAGPASYAQAVARAAPAVVNVQSARAVDAAAPSAPGGPSLDEELFRRFFPEAPDAPRAQLQTSLGSGVIVTRAGHVLTNRHVIAGAERIRVMLRDGREAVAEVVGTDPDTDLAVLRIDLEDPPTVTVRGNARLQVGDVVLAIGNPFGVGQTVTMGIVSATGRSRLGINTFEDFIQTDAAINPGNSGGALVDAQGGLIGINTAIFSRTGGSDGIGFAIPMELATEVMTRIIELGYVPRGWLGIEIRPLAPSVAEALGARGATGVVVAAVHGGGPAARAGLRPGDVITRVAGRPVSDSQAAVEAITAVAPGERVRLHVLRDGDEREIAATVGQRPHDVRAR